MVRSEVASPERRFVGRASELDELFAGFDAARGGRGRLFLLAGEAGIGKTRLADELVQRAESDGARALWGRCWEGGGAPPFWPWVQVVRAARRGAPPSDGAGRTPAGSGLEALLAADDGAPDGAEQTRFALFDAVGTFFQDAAASRPLVIVLEDLHAADESSLLLLQFLARELRDAALLLLGTYRDTDLRRAPALLPIVADLVREGQRLALRGLSRSEVGEFIGAAAAAPPAEPLIDAVYEATAGNPFFVTEVVRLWLADARRGDTDPGQRDFEVPDEVRALIRRRLTPLSDGARELLGIAAVIGRDLDPALLARVAPPGAPVEEQIAEATAAGLIEPGSGGRPTFAHALVRQTLYGDLSPSRRVVLHRAVAEALEAHCGADLEPYLSDLAHHFFHAAAAGVAERAVIYASRAGDQAVRQLAFEEAAIQYERALRALDLRRERPTDAAADARLRSELLLALGHAQRRAGARALWRPTFKRAATCARTLAQASSPAVAAPLLARIALGFGRGSETGLVDAPLIELLEEALAALGDADPALRARLLARLSMALYFSADAARGVALSAEAVALAEHLDEVTLLHCLVARHFALWRPDTVEERVAIAARIVELGERARERELTLEGQLWLIADRLERGDGAALAPDLAAFARNAVTAHQPIYRWHATLHAAMSALADADLDRAESASNEALAYGDRAGLENPGQAFGIQSWYIRREQGRLAELSSVVGALAERFPLPIWRCGLALLLAETGQVAAAQRELDGLAVDGFATLPRDGNWLPAMAILSEVCVALRDRGRAEQLYTQLLPFAPHAVVIGQAIICAGPVTYYLGLLAGVLERWSEASAHLGEALRVSEQSDQALPIAQARSALAAISDAPDAASLRAAVHRLATARGLVRLAARVAAPPVSPPPAARPAPAPAAEARASGAEAVFRQDGQYWTVGFEGTVTRLKHSRGLAYIGHLLRHPGQEIHAVELATTFAAGERSAAEGDAGAALDPAARAAYRERAEELQGEIEEAEAFNDIGRAERARDELERLGRELAAAIGLGETDRPARSNAERARVAVTKAITLALKVVAETNPPLRRYFAATIKTGQFCSFTPDPRFAVRWGLQ